MYRQHKKASLEFLSNLGISSRSLYRESKSLGVLKFKDFYAQKIARHYVIAYAEEEPPIVDAKPQDFDIHDFDPHDYFGEVHAEIISLQEKRVIGTCEGRVYFFLDMAGMFSPRHIAMCLDDIGIDNAEVGIEMMKRKQLKYLLTLDADTNVFHLEFLKILRSHRGQDLGLKALNVLIEYAATILHCGYVIIKPYPLSFEAGDADVGGDPTAFAQARRKLFDYYQRLGFVRTSPKSAYLYKATKTRRT